MKTFEKKWMSLMKKQSLTLSSFIIIFLFILIYSYGGEKSTIKGKAIIIDGDTIKINDKKIRFGGIDSPERGKIGHEFSKDKLIKKIGKKNVICFKEKKKDYWNRIVAECFIEDESISSYMVKNGYACDYVKYSNKKYAKEEKYAKSNKLGIWKMKFDPAWEKKCIKNK